MRRLGEADVREPRVQVLVEQDVRRLDVAMQHERLVLVAVLVRVAVPGLRLLRHEDLAPVEEEARAQRPAHRAPRQWALLAHRHRPPCRHRAVAGSRGERLADAHSRLERLSPEGPCPKPPTSKQGSGYMALHLLRNHSVTLKNKYDMFDISTFPLITP